MRHRSRILPEQQSQRVLLLLYLLLQLRKFRGSRVKQLLGLPEIRERNGAAALQPRRQVNRLLPGL